MTVSGGLDAVVAQHFPGARLRATEPLTGGVSAEVHRLDLVLADGSPFRIVLRAFGPDHAGLDPALEFRLLRTAHEAGIPVPRPLFVDTSGALLECSYLLMSFVEGSTTIAGDTAEACITAMADALAAVHGAPARTLPDLPERLDPLPELLRFLPKEPEWHGLRDHLSRLEGTGYEGTAVLLHGDFWPGNLIWRDGQIAAVLDWEDAAVGDPLSDVACTWLQLRYLYGTTGADRFRNAFTRQTSVDPWRFALWRAYVAGAAQCYMGEWGLEPSREAQMRRTALTSLREAGSELMA